jgi:hypothetical protein
VHVVAEQVGGAGGSASRGRGGAGASSFLESVVDGATTGELHLEQRAIGGHGGDSIPTEIGGDGGDARSILTRETQSAQLQVTLEAVGGDAGVGSAAAGRAAAGTAQVVADLRNTGGGVEANAHALGGAQYREESPYSQHGGAQGGDAFVDVAAVTERAGDAISIGQSSEPGTVGAIGGRGGDDDHYTTPGDAGRGGDALSTSSGIASGDAVVEVRDLAVGGDGGRVRLGGSGPIGAGGSATSTAMAQNFGISSVRAESSARGGAAGSNASSNVPGIGGGDAFATATAESRGAAFAGSQASSGRGSDLESAGFAQSTSTARSLALAHATSRSLGYGDGAASARSLLGSASGGAVIAVDASLQASGRAGSITEVTALARDLGNGHHLPMVSSGSSIVVDADGRAAGGGTLAEIDLRLDTNVTNLGRSEVVLSQSSVVDLMLDLPEASDRSLALVFSDVETTAEGFDSLSLSVRFLDIVILAETFASPEEATSFLEGMSLALGSLDAGAAGSLVYSVDMLSSTAGDAFSWTATLQVVPEPATGTFVLVGLTLIGVARRRRPS